MKCNVLVTKEIDIKPGDAVRIIRRDGNGEARYLRTNTVLRLVETIRGTYAVFIDYTWRPLSTYGITWEKMTKC